MASEIVNVILNRACRLEADTLNILFIHPNFPGQFKALINSLVSHKNVRLAFITTRQDAEQRGVIIKKYAAPERQVDGVHKYLRTLNQDMNGAQEITKAAIELAREGFVATAVVGHIGWAGLMFMREVFPDAKLIGYTEWYFKWQNSWEHFSGEKLNMDQKISTRMLNATSVLGIEALDACVTPTHWQRSVFPKMYQRNMHVIHEGIDTNTCEPQARRTLFVPGCLKPLSPELKLVTYVSRAMEPARGFFTFMDAAARLAKLDPEVQFVIVGRPHAAYSGSTGDGPTYKEQAIEKYDVDMSRMHFCGKLQYDDYLQVLKNSSVHVHFSMPYTLSWSALEAMACGCAMVGSSNAPVNEAIEHDVNGRLVNFFDAEGLVREVQDLLADRNEAERLGLAARETVLSRYESADCVNQWKALILRTINANYPEMP